MKFKLDENLGSRGKALLEAEGHDVMTIAEQQMSGAQDERPPKTRPRAPAPRLLLASTAPIV